MIKISYKNLKNAISKIQSINLYLDDYYPTVEEIESKLAEVKGSEDELSIFYFLILLLIKNMDKDTKWLKQNLYIQNKPLVYAFKPCYAHGDYSIHTNVYLPTDDEETCEKKEDAFLFIQDWLLSDYVEIYADDEDIDDEYYLILLLKNENLFNLIKEINQTEQGVDVLFTKSGISKYGTEKITTSTYAGLYNLLGANN